MRRAPKKYAYIICVEIILCLLVGIFLYSKLPTKRIEKNIVLVNSFKEKDKGYGSFQQLLEKHLRKAGIEPKVSVFYLDCESYNDYNEVERIIYFSGYSSFSREYSIYVDSL